MIQHWGFSERHLRIKWEDLNDVSEEVKTQCKEFVDSFTLDKNLIFANWKQGKPNGLYIHSSINGTGKTSVVHQIAKDIISLYSIRKMRFLGGIKMFMELKQTFDPRGGVKESEVLDSIFDSDVFILDDIDKLIKWTQYEKERATLIFDDCYCSMKCVIITSNKSLQQLLIDGQLESHLHSRLTEMCKVIEIKDKQDYRLKINGLEPKKKFL